MSEQVKILRKLRLIISMINIVGLLSLFSITITTFAHGIGDTTLLYLFLYPTLLISTILVITKIRLGFYLTLFTSLSYSLLLTNEVGKCLIFDFDNNTLFWILLLPYTVSLVSIPLTIRYLTNNLSFSEYFKFASILISISIFIFSITDRLNKNYTDNIFVDAEIDNRGQITLNCKPNFGDSRTFAVTTNSKEIEGEIKRYGELYQGSYFLQNVKIEKKFRFNELQSVTLTKIGDNVISPQLTWMTNEIKGDIGFLQP